MNSLKSKLFLTGFLISIVPIITYQFVTFFQSSQTLQSTYAKELREKTELTTLLINKSIFHSLSDFKMTSRNITEWINLNDINQIKNQCKNLKNIHFDLDSVTLFSNSGEYIYSTYESTYNKQLSVIAKKMIQEYQHSDMEDVFIYEYLDDNEPKIFILNKIYSKDTHFIVAEANFQNIELLLSNFEDEILGEKPIILLNKKNQVVFSTNEIKKITISYSENIPFNDVENVYRYIDNSGDDVLSTYDNVFGFGINNALGWKVVTSIPINIINDKVYKTLAMNVNIGLVMTFLIFALLTYLTRSISKSIRTVLDFAQKLEKGEYSARVKGKNSIKEFDELTSILNDMSYTIEKRDNELVEKNQLFENLAHYDTLTAIPNRMLFQDRLDHALNKAKRTQCSLALLFIDLDQFKHVNDSFGHDYGDEILKISAKRLKSILRKEDMVARLGGDEFTIILEDIREPQDIHTIASKVISIIKESIVIKEYDFGISCSVGISMYPQDATNRTDLIKYADTAMYKAKAIGRNTYQFYSSELTKISVERIQLEKEIRQGLKNEEFIVFYQPQVNSLTKEISGMEALVRWNHPQRGLLTPIHFLPLAQEIGIIDLIDEYIMRTAMIQLVKWHNHGYNPGILALNLSMKMLEEDDFIQNIANLLLQTNCEAQWIELEVTEGQIMKNHENSIKKLNQITNIGIQIAIDDFGTGYSSLAYLKHLPLNKLKIDKSFVDNLPDDLDDIQIVKTILLLAKGLHLNILAEGVETQEQEKFLNENGCIHIQGYLYSKPVSAPEMENILIDNTLVV